MFDKMIKFNDSVQLPLSVVFTYSEIFSKSLASYLCLKSIRNIVGLHLKPSLHEARHLCYFLQTDGYQKSNLLELRVGIEGQGMESRH